MKLSKRALLLPALALLTGCSHEKLVATAKPVCASVNTVCISKNDKLTEGTATQIEGNNLAIGSLCKPEGDPCAGVRVKPSPKIPTPAPAKVAEAKTS